MLGIKVMYTLYKQISAYECMIGQQQVLVSEALWYPLVRVGEDAEYGGATFFMLCQKVINKKVIASACLYVFHLDLTVIMCT